MARQRLKKSHLRTKHTQGVDTCWDIILLPFCWSCDQLSSWVFSLCANNSGDSTDVLLYIVSAFYFWILNKCYTQSALSVSFNCFLVSHVIASGICSVEEFSRLLISHIESTILFFFFLPLQVLWYWRLASEEGWRPFLQWQLTPKGAQWFSTLLKRSNREVSGFGLLVVEIHLALLVYGLYLLITLCILISITQIALYYLLYVYALWCSEII